MHQYLFHIGDFPIRMYGLMMCLAIFLATGVAYFLTKKDGRGWDEYITDIGIYGGFCGIIGGRLWDVFFFDWDYYSGHLLEIPFVWQGGMAIQGGIIGGILGGIAYCIYHKIDYVALLDLVTPAIIMGQSIGRMANLLNGDAFGSPTGSSFGILYPEGTLAHATYGNLPLWPAEVWEGQCDIIIFVLLLLFQTTKYARGQVFCLYVMLYSLLRFCLEMLRGDYVQPFFLGLKSAQATSLIFFIIALSVFIYTGTKQKTAKQ
ncbi:MAG: prolipoprotein diacylglyceryl transferase [Acidaminococcaceae bacterium]|nr:prolipoprotein diacylglyceryl transferase [Acidaminococcaceae bacterium]